MRIYWYADGTFEKATGASIFAESEDSNKIEFKLPMAEADSIVHATFLLPYPQNSEQFGHYIAESLLLHLEEDTEDGGYVWVGTIPGGYLANNGTAYISARVESNDLLVVKTTQQVQFEIQAGGAYQATAVLPEQGEQLEAELARQNLEILRLDDEKQDKADNSLETTNKTVVGGINAGVSSDNTLYFTKGVLDFVSSMALCVSLGAGVLFASVFVFVFQGALVLSATFIEPLLTPHMIAEMNCTGSLLILIIGLNLIGITKIKVADYLPSIVFATLLSIFI